MRDHSIEYIIFETFSVTQEHDKEETISKLDSFTWPDYSQFYFLLKIVDLVENGRDKDVDDDNKAEYIKLMVAWRTEFAVRRQLDAFLQGFRTLVPSDTLADFSIKELAILLNGKDDVDVDEMRAFTAFQGGYNANSQQVLWLWQALREFSSDFRGAFLKVRFSLYARGSACVRS